MKTLAETHREAETAIFMKYGERPSYQQFFDEFIRIFRANHPNSSRPSNELIGQFYDSYIGTGEILPY